MSIQKLLTDYQMGTTNLGYRLYYLDEEDREKSVAPASKRKFGKCCMDFILTVEREMDRRLGVISTCEICKTRFILKLASGRLIR